MIKKLFIVTCYVLQILNADDVIHAKPAPDESPGSRGPALFGKQGRKQCLTGYMTDLQDWVDEFGNLNPALDYRYLIDVSSRQDAVRMLMQQIEGISKSSPARVTFLSLSNCNLKRVPTVFSAKDRRGQALHSTVKYLTLYGNDFSTISSSGVEFDEEMNATNAMEFSDVAIRWPGPVVWSSGFDNVKFERLKELDLRRCNIQHLTDGVFQNMPKLEALYLGENHISFISSKAFAGLPSLLHLDISRNFDGFEEPNEIIFEHKNVFNILKSLKSLDLSMTAMPQRDLIVLKNLYNLTRLSICYTGLMPLTTGLLSESSLKYLDVSGNNGLFNGPKPLQGLEDTLEVLYAKEVGLNNFDLFKNFSKLEVLNLERNEINSISLDVTKTLSALQILNLSSNRLTAWFRTIYSVMNRLKFLSLRDNNINVITQEMISDIQNITYVGLSNNFIVCNCHARELFEVAYRNENLTQTGLMSTKYEEKEPFAYHRAFQDFNNLVFSRETIKGSCRINDDCENEELVSNGIFVLYDYHQNGYHCLEVSESKSRPFSDVNVCNSMLKNDYYEVITESGRKLLVLIVIPVVIFPMILFCYVFRRNFKYFWITIRNSATLSLINKNKGVDDGTIFNYDVFVSYCNDDRNWVLDELLPNVEKGCNISVCLHERDFQVGLSILENIVSCMDRSRSIMLIISKQFLMSQWCQFEMHLAQHRLLETRREDLILVLLEDIPRGLRPTTLHYLMLTKTYIVWPRKQGEIPAFWKRLSRSIIARRQNGLDNVSLV